MHALVIMHIMHMHSALSGYYNANHYLCRAFPSNFYRAMATRHIWAPRIPPTSPATRLPMGIFNTWARLHPHGTLAQSGHRFFNAWIRCYPVVK